MLQLQKLVHILIIGQQEIAAKEGGNLRCLLIFSVAKRPYSYAAKLSLPNVFLK